MNKFLKASVGIFFISVLLFLNSGLALADDVPGTKITNPHGKIYKCELDDAGQKTLRVNRYGPVDKQPCPIYQDQQSLCKELSDGVVCTYTPAGNPTQTNTNTNGGLYWTINDKDPGETNIDGNTAMVKITFSGLDPSAGVAYVFRKTDQDLATSQTLDKLDILSDGTITLTVCGAGSDALKAKGVGSNRDCKPDGSDFFHEGNIYRLGLYDDKFGQAQIMVAEFYVHHSAPIIKVNPINKGNLTAVRVDLSGRRYGGNNENNYQLVLESERGYKTDYCLSTNKSGPNTIKLGDQKDFFIPSPSINEANPANKTFTQGATQTGLTNGNYLLKVNAQTHDTGLLKNSCSGGFTYWDIPISVGDGTVKLNGTAKQDPNGEEYGAFLDFLAKMNNADAGATLPCSQRSAAGCTSVDTAIGPISVTPTGFITSIFKLVLFLATFGGIIIIIYSGYMLMISRGDKEKIAGARETITAAIVGLLFIVLAIVILEIIGVDILRIPGFTR